MTVPIEVLILSGVAIPSGTSVAIFIVGGSARQSSPVGLQMGSMPLGGLWGRSRKHTSMPVNSLRLAFLSFNVPSGRG